jgi:thioredoxin reductase
VAESARHIVIIGAGPIGLEAALAALDAGYLVNVYEKGQVAENVRDWGHVRLFSSFGLNSSNRGREVLQKSGGDLPEIDSFITGREFATRYLIPLAKSPLLAECVHVQTSVRFIGRCSLHKREAIGRPSRADDGFRLLIEDEQGERYETADIVLDCSGTYPHHNWIGAGGIPCVGETAALTARDYRIPDITTSQRSRFIGCQTVVIGSGYSAATAVVGLAELAVWDPATRIVWITRNAGAAPMTRIENDTLPERDRLSRTANTLALDAESSVEWMPERQIVGIRSRGDVDGFLLHLEGPHGPEELPVDRVIANVGYRPDRDLYEELQVHECYTSQGPIKLAAALLGETSTDCLAQSDPDPQTLVNPEPDFFILGAKSYGRDSRFLINIGLKQIDAVMTLLAKAEQGK